MNIYAINLVRKWNQLSSKHDSFTDYVSHVFTLCKDSDIDLKKVKEHNSLNKIFTNLFEAACVSFIGMFLISFVVMLVSYSFKLTSIYDFFSNIPQLSLIAAGLTILIFTYIHFFKEPEIMKEKLDKTALVLKTFNENITDELENNHNFQSIIPILEAYIPKKEFKQILININDKTLNSHNLEYIYVALNEYYLSNISSENFKTLQSSLDNFERTTIKESDNQDIQFFSK